MVRAHRFVRYADEQGRTWVSSGADHNLARGGQAEGVVLRPAQGDNRRDQVDPGEYPGLEDFMIQPAARLHLSDPLPYAEPRCRVEVPALREVRPGHMVACHLR
jgi:hypothetical protein